MSHSNRENIKMHPASSYNHSASRMPRLNAFATAIVTACGLVALAAPPAEAQVNIGGLSKSPGLFGAYNYTQNFNTLPFSGPQTTWVNPGGTLTPTLANWWANQTGNGDFRITNGSGNPSGLLSFGASGSQERALGMLPSGQSAAANAIQFGSQFFNNTQTIIKYVTIEYTGEQWRAGNKDDPLAYIDFSWLKTSLAGNQLSVAGYQSTGFIGPPPGYETNPQATSNVYSTPDFKRIIPGSTAVNGPLDGNLDANRRKMRYTYQVDLQPGQYLWLRYSNGNAGGSDAGLAIDDFSASFQPVPAPPALVSTGIGGAVMALPAVLGALRRRRRGGKAAPAAPQDESKEAA